MPDYTQLHEQHHDDYTVAKAQIYQHIGTVEPGDLDLFGRQVLVAVYVRPNVSKGGVILSPKQQTEDIWQGKAVMVLQLGPDAFSGEKDYLAATYGPGGAPKVEDWLFLPSAVGMPLSFIGEGGTRAKCQDMRGDPMDIYNWSGWPCRIVPDDQFAGRIARPHSVV